MSGLASSMAVSRPKRITGGCLCRGVRYEVEFSPEHDWKRGPHSCQCTMCRKTCGSLVYNFHTVKASEIEWTSQATYAEYNSSPGCYRSFCKKCGSPLAWSDRKVNTDIELAVGTMDEEFLLGDRDADDQALGAHGVALANPEADHFHIRNQIPGVTDGISAAGTRFWRGSKEGPMTTSN
ncbi:Mss4-like protein [Leptodontidium sp. 2 PMI_412]|nr:Mss4-like protein [Leptodontidium sp. 2 PMI_412]